MSTQREVVGRLNDLVTALDDDVLRLARRYPWAFPAGSSVDAMLSSGRRVSLEDKGSEYTATDASLRQLEDALACFERTHGFSLLSYSPPSSALTGDSSHGFDLADTFGERDSSGADLSAINEPTTGVMGRAEAVDVQGLAGLLPITAALMAAKDAPLFNVPVLTRLQAREVAFARQMQLRHAADVNRAHARLTTLVDKLQGLLDSAEFREQLSGRLVTLCSGHDEKGQAPERFPVSGDYEETVWQRWVPSASTDKRSKTREEVIQLSLSNKQRLEELLARWSRAKQRYAVLVERANRATCAMALNLDERKEAIGE